VTIKTTAKLSVSGRVKQDASPMTRNVKADEGAEAMTAHSLFSPEQRAEQQRGRDRAREAMQSRQVQANAGKDQVALDMEPLSLTAAIQAKKKKEA